MTKAEEREKQKMQKELEEYQAHNSTTKPYVQIMQEMSKHLKSKENR